MKGDIALAGFVLTAEEWQTFDLELRAQLMAAASHKDDAWVVSEATGLLSGPMAAPQGEDR